MPGEGGCYVPLMFGEGVLCTLNAWGGGRCYVPLMPGGGGVLCTLNVWGGGVMYP